MRKTTSSFPRRETAGIQTALKASVLAVLSALSGAGWAGEVNQADDANSPGYLRGELTNGNVNNITFGVNQVTLNWATGSITLGNGAKTLNSGYSGASPVTGLFSGGAYDALKTVTAPGDAAIADYKTAVDAAIAAATGSGGLTFINSDSGSGNEFGDTLITVPNGASLALSGVRFDGFFVNKSGSLYGGGVVGAYAYGTATLGDISDSVFSGNTISATYDSIYGGGVAGAYSQSGTATLGDIGDSVFSGNTISARYIFGGGVAGAYSDFSSATLGDISDSVFSGNTISADYYIFGGGVAGAYSDSGTATLGPISHSVFSGNMISAVGIRGGGVVGAYSSSSATLGDISDSVFSGNTISA
jgi:hypothetical protein